MVKLSLQMLVLFTNTYQNVDESIRNDASQISDKYYENPYNVSGNVIGVDLQEGEIYIYN